LVSDEELRDALLNSSDEFRGQALWQLEKWSTDGKSSWHKNLASFLKNVWPKHKKIRTSKTSARLCDIALSQEKNFPVVSGLVIDLISKVGDEYVHLPEMRKSGEGLASKYPRELLALLHAMLPERPEKWPYGTREALKSIELAAPELLNDPRLIELKVRLSDI